MKTIIAFIITVAVVFIHITILRGEVNAIEIVTMCLMIEISLGSKKDR